MNNIMIVVYLYRYESKGKGCTDKTRMVQAFSSAATH